MPPRGGSILGAQGSIWEPILAKMAFQMDPYAIPGTHSEIILVARRVHFGALGGQLWQLG